MIFLIQMEEQDSNSRIRDSFFLYGLSPYSKLQDKFEVCSLSLMVSYLKSHSSSFFSFFSKPLY